MAKTDVISEAITEGERPGGFSAAAAPYRIIDRRSSYGYNNTLIEAATQSEDRKTITLVDYDLHRTVSVIGRRTLLSLARTMFWRIPALQAAILEQAHLAVSPFTPVFMGPNEKWGRQARDWLDGFHAVMDCAGWPYNYESYCELLIISSIVDGDIFTLLTRDSLGNPRVQMIQSHRIGSRYQTGGSAKVRYQGNQLFIDDKLIDTNLPQGFPQSVEWEATLIDGVILDDLSRPIAYRVYDDPVVSANYQDISARNLFPAFLPMIPGQVRSYSMLSSSVFDWQDVREFRRFEMLAQKTFASKTIVEQNESGEADAAKAIVSRPASFDASGNKTGLDAIKLDGGAYTYFKAGTSSKLEAFNWGDRPGRGTQDFLDSTVRDAMRGTEWDAFFSLDPQQVGGAPLRVIVDRVNRTLKKRRRLAGMNVMRVDTYALATAIQNGDLPFDPNWFRWTYRAQPDVTADRRYDSQTDEMEYRLGWMSLEDVEARRQGDWMQKREQIETEVRDKYTRAKRIAEEFGISIQEAAMQLGMTGTSSFQVKETGNEDDSGAPETPAPAAPPKPAKSKA